MKDKSFLFKNVLILIFGLLCFYSLKTLFEFISSLTEWNNKTYQIFLQLIISFLIILLFLVVSIYESYKQKKLMTEKIHVLEKDIVEKIKIIEELNNDINMKKIYSTISHTLSKDMLFEYIEQIFERKIEYFSVFKIKCKSKKEEDRFLLHINFVKEKNMVVFNTKQLEYCILLIGTDKYDVNLDMDFIIPKYTDCCFQKSYISSKTNKEITKNELKEVFN